MKKIWKGIKMTLLTILGIILLLVIGILIFTSTAPQFGQAPKGDALEKIKESPHFQDGQFVNPIKTEMGGFSEMMRTMPDFLFGKNKEPKDSIPADFEFKGQEVIDSICYVSWFGHSAFLIELDNQRILIDPMLTERPTPISFGTKRFAYQDTIPLASIENIDFVILSHDHYDHLDYKSILKLKDKVGHFYTALGIGSHLQAWGVDQSKITELDWWQKANAGGIELIACPARHFSGRGLFDSKKTQWASWVIKGKKYKLYFSGDSGFGPHFKEIGEKHGPFDFAMLECGQYNEAWADIHMMPEESVQAGIDVMAEVLMPIHWGAFALSVHQWKEPIQRFQKEANRLNQKMIHPIVGERFRVGMDFPQEEWWEEMK